MGRSLVFPLLLIALAVGGFPFVRQAQSVGPTSRTATQAEAQAASAAATTDFGAAQAAVLSWFAAHGTYAGVTLSPVYAVAVVRADASSFCLQAGAGAAATHELGPGGQAQSGPC
jgi:hypothetical protein